MTEPRWVFDGNNGDVNQSSIRAYGLGVQVTTNTAKVDVIFPNKIMSGHKGEDHGLVSNVFIDLESGDGYAFAINGCLHPYDIDKNVSEFYFVEY